MKEKKQEKNKKATTKRMSCIFNIKTKQNQMEIDGTEKKKNLKKNPKQIKTNKKTMIIIEFFYQNNTIFTF